MDKLVLAEKVRWIKAWDKVPPSFYEFVEKEREIVLKEKKVGLV